MLINNRTWVILGASSIIAENFAHIAAQHGTRLVLVGRNNKSLDLIAKDIHLRYKVPCSVVILDMASTKNEYHTLFSEECDLFIAHSDFTVNADLDEQRIDQLVQVNVTNTILLISQYLLLQQKFHNIVYLSSVAGCRGRSKNSLYGASKKAVEVYLEGIQQAAPHTQNICIVRLGLIDTKQTYGIRGLIPPADPEACAKACWKAWSKHRRLVYFPKYWMLIMGFIRFLPFYFYKKMKGI